ncbi:SVEP1-like protein [Mya arenaria]|uniref:SVEP1-like protein n=1 Tax=Mya arenaria TaxID=6604 RepID=A0ABY7G5V2_MYAAR|nr:SVEP1-like protein [Mya arenaria]
MRQMVERLSNLVFTIEDDLPVYPIKLTLLLLQYGMVARNNLDYTLSFYHGSLRNKTEEFCQNHLVKQALDKDAGKNCPEIPALQNGTYDTRGAHKHGDVALENGSYDTRGPHKPGDVVIATCDPGFTLIGHSTLTCAKHGQWDNTPPTCKEKDCPEIPSLENGTYDIRGPHTHGDVVVATCHPGYKLLGHSKLICGKYGRWDNIPPTCKALSCPSPPQLMNGQWEFDQIEIPLLGIKTEQAPVEMELKEMVTKHPVSQQDTAVQTEGTWTENNNQDGQGTSEPNTNDLTDSSASQASPFRRLLIRHLKEN